MIRVLAILCFYKAYPVSSNAVTGEFNFHELPNLVHEVSLIGVDYIEIKGEYFEAKTAAWFHKLDEALT